MMNYKEVKELFNTAQQKVMLEKGMLRGVTIPDAKAMGYTDIQVSALVAAKRVMAPKEKKVAKIQVSEKGALAVYGLGRFPVTLYRDQWEILLDSADLIRNAITANSAQLATKPTV